VERLGSAGPCCAAADPREIPASSLAIGAVRTIELQI
jgi:hypothetical protein